MRLQLSKESSIAKPGFNRWLIAPAALGIHLCIGSVYAWSLFNPTLTKRIGIVASAADDWSLSDVVWIFTVAIVSLGLAAAIAGRWLEEAGPRLVGVISATAWGGGFVIGGLGIVYEQLWLLYFGYGVIGGFGLGLGYVSPVSTLIKWFPDRRGMATGIAIMGFGGGAILAKPMIEGLLQFYYTAPTYLGLTESLDVVTENGRRMVTIAGQLREVVVVGKNDVAQMVVASHEGVYLSGTGSVGVAQTFFTLGGIYLTIMLIAAFSYRVPSADWSPPVPVRLQEGKKKSLITAHDVDINQAMKTPQFYLLWIVLCFNVAAGIGVLAVAKTMITEIFGSTLPQTVNANFAATYVLMISIFNMLGRFFWASLSDYIGRKNTYYIFFSLGLMLYSSIPYFAHEVSVSPEIFWLVCFYATTMLIFTMYGGGFATIPAYLADIFGTRFVGGIHGRLLTAWSTAGVIGPLAITTLRERAVEQAIKDLTSKVNPALFQKHFGESPDKLELLVEMKTVTIRKLMEIVPPGTIDPTPQLYNGTMYLMAFLLFLALVANFFISPVASKHHIKNP